MSELTSLSATLSSQAVDWVLAGMVRALRDLTAQQAGRSLCGAGWVRLGVPHRPLAAQEGGKR